MKIEFLWFDHYKQLDNFQANLGSPYVYEFDGTKTLNVTRDDKYIDGYFKDDSSFDIDVTAIVGENGVGKSTILDFFRDFIISNLEDTKCLLIFNDNGRRLIWHNISADTIDLYGEKVDIEQCRKGFNFIEEDSLKLPKTMIFSNVFDARYLSDYSREHDSEIVRNITTNYLLSTSQNNIMFLNDEFEKQIYFIFDFMNTLELIGIINIPEKIEVKLINEFKDHETEYFDLSPVELELKHRVDMLDFSFLFDINSPKEYFGVKINVIEIKVWIFKNVLYRYLEEIEEVIKNSDEEMISKMELSSIYQSYHLDTLKETLKISYIKQREFDEKNILEYLPLMVYSYIFEETNLPEDILNSILKNMKNISREYQKFVDCIKAISLNETVDSRKTTRYYMLRNDDTTKDFIRNHKLLFDQDPIINFSWQELSSGEYGILNLFARIYTVLRNGDSDGSYINSYLLLIDEGDLYFHPQWQKDWLYYFLQFVKQAFNNNVQIILTTHSPLVLSDFPNSNVVFLGKKVKNVYQLEGSPRTLGANILELFSNSFFLKGGLVGQYGKNKINTVIRELIEKSPREIIDQREYYEDFIDNIGEPLVRNKAMELYKEKIALASKGDIDRKIQYLEEEIEKLKNMQRNPREND